MSKVHSCPLCGNHYKTYERLMYHVEVHVVGKYYLTLAPPMPETPASSASSTNGK
ncbi:hypothetical protein DCAR_0206390 [Daucus carota subsp. sativus]|uniref:C2H2-type domain-containing protein n=1 Tax=Daucus carota subsp. sativus TaxID=79200 RepID=A0A161XJQ4_DAUCS|nr:hypothetical protein DCAR_0206390 [Daucus carota subsp. sativus]